MMANLKLRKSLPPSSTELERVLALVPELNLQFDEAAADALLAQDGTLFVAEIDGELAVIDFKTSEKPKPEEWLEDYFVQLSAYWAMFSEATGVVPKKLVTFSVCENNEVQIIERRNIMKYLNTLRDYASQFIQHRDA